MSMININELYNKQDEKIKKKLEIYDKVLEKCHHRIKLTAFNEPNLCYCYYVIPKFIYGIPLYNLQECVRYLFNCLNKNGFKTYYTHPNLLIISWIRDGTQINKSNVLNAKSKDYKVIEDYKPSGNLIYNTNSLEILNKKKNNLFN